ncbi:hypothetical protein [Streptomyces sp. NPDC059262]|uniref:hypothetical protein n=1 Tax=Streptomyces sp. NPDC059262 TaxID=3346797 RepID=UPI0036BC0FCD
MITEIEDRDPHVPEIPAFPSDANFAPNPEARGGGLDALLDLLAERGRGLSIVNELTRGAWGFKCTRTTKVAWAQFPANLPPLLMETVARQDNGAPDEVSECTERSYDLDR